MTTSDALSGQGVARAARTIAPLVLFVLLPLVVAAAQWSDLSGRFDTYGFDFRGTLWEPARAVLDGTSPYPHPDDPSIVTGNPSVYPPLAILALVPLARVDFDVAYVLWSVLLIGACGGRAADRRAARLAVLLAGAALSARRVRRLLREHHAPSPLAACACLAMAEARSTGRPRGRRARSREAVSAAAHALARANPTIARDRRRAGRRSRP